jgi:hypothetical protein
MRDPRRIIEALLKKTVANGATEGEERVAREKAEELAAKYGVELPRAKPRREQPRTFRTVGEMAEHLIRTTPLTNAEIAERCRQKFGSKTTAQSVAWYRSRLRKEAAR